MKKLLPLLLILLLSFSFVSAIEGRIGNSRMILRAETGEIVERSILVINENSVPVEINVFASGELEENVVIREDAFVLRPGEEKKAYFTITANEEGTTETKINIKFIPTGDSGIGLSSTVILIASGESLDNNFDDLAYDDSDDSNQNDGETEGLSTSTILALSTALLVIILIVLVIYSKNKKAKKKSVRRRSG